MLLQFGIRRLDLLVVEADRITVEALDRRDRARLDDEGTRDVEVGPGAP
ncbi:MULTISPECIES: hypothetical protein [unclassified Methylobacterium]|nr:MULTISPECIES: hypothetical protein [unclassified Methylobacterium]